MAAAIIPPDYFILTVYRGFAITATVLAFILLLINYIAPGLKSWCRTWRKVCLIPGPFDSYPMVLNWIICRNFSAHHPHVDYNVSMFNFTNGYCEVYRKQKMYKYYLGFTPFIVIYSQEGMEAILSHAGNLNKGDVYSLLHYWLGSGLLTSNKEKWRGRRKMLTPAFHFRILEDILPVMDKEANVLVSKLLSVAKDQPVEIVSLVQLCTLSIICETAMGVEIKAQENKESPYVKAVLETGESFMYRITTPWLWSNFIFHYFSSYGRRIKGHLDFMHSFAQKIIEERKASLLQENAVKEDLDESTEKKRKSFIDILLELHLDNDAFTMKDIREEVDTFMFEGHDTTSVGVSFALYLIGLHPEVQQKIYEELQEIFKGDTQRSIAMEDLKKMKYLECVLKESQRLYPSVPIVARVVDEDFHIGDTLIPEGSNVDVFIYGLHHDPAVFPKPHEFLPERFLQENMKGRNPYAFVPFSAGSRNCIGQKFALMEEKVIVATLLRRFKLTSLDPRDKLEIVMELVLRPKSGLRLTFTPRA